jgi:hypothetical protein
MNQTLLKPMSRLRHKWSKPNRENPECTIRTCINPNCGLIRHSCHDWSGVERSDDKGEHWSEYFKPDYPDVRLTVLPECVPKMEEANV